MPAPSLLTKVVLPAVALTLAGCATYHPQPLSDEPEVLAPPVASVLNIEAQKIDRPWLSPTTIDLARPLDANAVAVIAVLNNPDLKVQRARAHVTEAQAFAARLLPDPSVSLSFDRLISGPDQLDNLAVQLAQDIGMLRSAHVIAQAGRAQVRQVRLDLAWAEWQTASAARLQAVRVRALEEQVALNRVSAQSLNAQLDITLAAAGRGDRAGDAVQASRLAVLDAQDRLNVSETALAAARIELTRLLGMPPRAPLSLADPTPLAPIPSPARLFAVALRRRADLEALRAGYEAQEAAVHKAVLDQFPSLSLSLGGNRDTTGNKLVSSSVSFTLPLWNRNRGGIAIERANRATLKAEYEARLAQTRSDIVTAAEGIDIARRAVTEIEGQLPALERNAAVGQSAARRGDLSASAAVQLAQTLRDRRVQLSTARQALAEQLIALELLTGAPAATWEMER